MPAKRGADIPTSREAFDVAVVGGGIIGLAVAWRGRARGPRPCPLDPGGPGAAVADVRLGDGVTLAGGERVAAARVVIAAGPWSGELPGLTKDARVPVRPVKGQSIRLRDPSGPGLLQRVLRFPPGHLVPRGDGRYVLGATVEERGFDTAPTAGGLHELLRDASELVPGVLE